MWFATLLNKNVLALHATRCAPDCSWVYCNKWARPKVEGEEKMIFLATHAALKNKRERDPMEEAYELWEQQLVRKSV